MKNKATTPAHFEHYLRVLESEPEQVEFFLTYSEGDDPTGRFAIWAFAIGADADLYPEKRCFKITINDVGNIDECCASVGVASTKWEATSSGNVGAEDRQRFSELEEFARNLVAEDEESSTLRITKAAAANVEKREILTRGFELGVLRDIADEEGDVVWPFTFKWS